MRLSFTALLLAASIARGARAASVSVNAVNDRDHSDPAVEVKDAAGVDGGSGEEKRNLRGGKGGKGKKETKAKKNRGKVHKATTSTTGGMESCLATYREILSTRHYVYGGAGRCKDNMAVELTCESTKKCSFTEYSLRDGSTYAMDTCVMFNLSKELVYDVSTGTCTLGVGGIGLKRQEETTCRSPTAELSFKMTYDVENSSTLHIDFSRNGGDTFYTEEEESETRVAVPESLFERSLQTGECTVTIVDLSKKFERVKTCGGDAMNWNLHSNLGGTMDLRGVRRVLVLEGGIVVGDYERSDLRYAPKREVVHSLTKGLMSLAIGKVISEHSRLTLDTTLGEIFSNPTYDSPEWIPARDETPILKSIKIRELLTMTSGLPGGEASGETRPGNSLHEALYGFTYNPRLGGFGTKGNYSYVYYNNILSYVIREITGRTPLEYFQENIFPSLGISDTDIATCPNNSHDLYYFGTPKLYHNSCSLDDGEFAWFKNAEGIEGAFSGMAMTVDVMAKFGQLYLQGGSSGPGGVQVVPKSWIDDTLKTHVMNANGLGSSLEGGFLWYKLDEDTWFAMGFGGQIIAVNRRRDRVVVTQHDNRANTYIFNKVLKGIMDPEDFFNCE